MNHEVQKLKDRRLYVERMMLDGSASGVTLNSDTCDLPLDEIEATALKRAMRRLLKKKIAYIEGRDYKARKNDNEEYPLVVALRRHKNNEDEWFLNVDGNTAGHYQGSNVYGNSNVGWQIRGMFEDCLLWLQRTAEVQLPDSIMEKIRAGEINLYMMELAAYTKKTAADISSVINKWQYMYKNSSWKEDGKHVFLPKILGVKSYDTEDYETSFSVATLFIERNVVNGKQKIIRRTLAGIRLYDKLEQLGEEGIEIDDKTKKDIEGRLRVDLWLTRMWMRKARINTLQQMEEYVKRNHAGVWKDFIDFELWQVISKSALRYMFEFPNILDAKIKASIPSQWMKENVVDKEVQRWATRLGIDPNIPYKAHVAMLFARVTENLEGVDKALALESAGAFNSVMERKLSKKLNDIPTSTLDSIINLLTFDKGNIRV